MGKNVKGQLSELLTGVEEVSPQLFEGLLLKTGATASYLRRLLRQTPLRLHPLVEGVRQDSLDNLCRTLSGLSAIYGVDSKPCRDIVLDSKRHTRILLARDPANAWRNQVLLHLNIWLENPVIYPVWSQLQKKNAASS